MRYVLWIDDEPGRRALVTFPEDVIVIFAHGFEQIKYYLNSGIKFEFIILDHDMPLMNGMDVCRQFLIEKNYRVLTCTNNDPARRNMAALLTEYEVTVVLGNITNADQMSLAISAWLKKK